MRGRSRFSERARSISSFFVQGHRPRQPRGAAADPRAGAARFETGWPVLVLVAQRPRPRRRSRAGRSSWTALTGFNSCSISWTRPNRCANSPGRDRGDARSRSLGRGAGGKRRGDKPLGARPLSRPKNRWLPWAATVRERRRRSTAPRDKGASGCGQRAPCPRRQARPCSRLRVGFHPAL